MIEIENRLARHPATQAYVDFGLTHLELNNREFLYWLTKQTFAEEGRSAEFTHMEVDGNADYIPFPQISGPPLDCPDSVEWQLSFADKPKRPSFRERPFDKALLHEDRLPDDLVTFNSAPNIGISTRDYINFSVSDGTKGWVKRGEFPVGIRAVDRMVIDEEEGPTGERKLVGIQTDFRREAIAGFKAAHEWQKFRSMATSCSDYVMGALKAEAEKIHGPMDVAKLEKIDRRGARLERVCSLFVSLLPDTRLESGPSALKQFYRPGILEGAFSLGMETYIEGNNSLLFNSKGRPIEVVGTEESYDTTFTIDGRFCKQELSEDERTRSLLQDKLAKHYDITPLPKGLRLKFRLENAHLVEQQLKEGADNTDLHRFIENIGYALQESGRLATVWYEEREPDAKASYRATEDSLRMSHFERLEQRLRFGPIS